MRRLAGRAAAVLAVALVPVMLVVTPGSAAGMSQRWKVQRPPDVTAPTGSIQAMSCVSSQLCTAVGNYDNSAGVQAPFAEVWNGSSWRLEDAVSPPVSSSFTPSFTGVSCLSGQFCMAVGSTDTDALDGVSGFAEAWNGSAWSLVPIAQPPGAIGSELTAISCVTADFCEAVGVYRTAQATDSLAERWNGSHWRIQISPNQSGEYAETWLSGVSCVSTRFCQATDSSGPLIAQWNGSHWTARTAPRDPASLSSVSCESIAFCQAVGITGASLVSERWNGTRWQAATIVKAANGKQINAVSCGSASFCEAVGSRPSTKPGGSDAGFAVVWNGTSWRTQAVPTTETVAYGASLAAVSCSSDQYCEAGGSFPVKVDAWNGVAWMEQRPLIPRTPVDNDLDGVSCLSATFCEAVGGAGTNPSGLPEVWNGTKWTLQARASLYGDFSSVSCVSATFCEATGAEFAQWNGTTWKAQPFYPAPEYQSVSCASTAFCVAVGDNGAATWNGTTWKQATLPTASGSYISVSCVSATFCEAVAPNNSLRSGPGIAAQWNGTSWTSQPVPGPAGSTGVLLYSVSCISATFCEVAGLSGSTAFTDAWNGNAWEEQGALPVPAGSTRILPWSVSCVSAVDCSLAGGSTTSTGKGHRLIEGWDGTSWTIETTSAEAGSWLHGISCLAAGPCIAVGWAPKGPVTATLAEISS